MKGIMQTLLRSNGQAVADTTTTTTNVDPLVECIAKQQQVRGMSYDEAKKYCLAESTQTLNRLLWAVSRNTCRFSASPPMKRKIVHSRSDSSRCDCSDKNRCGELETRLNILIEKLRIAQGQDAESIMKDIMAIRPNFAPVMYRPSGNKDRYSGHKEPVR